MLVLSRRIGEEIVIDGGIRITIVAVRGNQVRIGIAAPPAGTADRSEVAQRRKGAADTLVLVPAVVQSIC